MDRREAYRRRLEAEIARLKAVAEDRLTSTRAEHPREMEQVEARIAAAKAKLAELADAGGGRWEELKGRLEAARKAVEKKRREAGR
jgi:hypothetical protein